MVNEGYLVEAWRGMECIGFRRVARLATVVSTATTYIVDQGADRVYVRRGGDTVAAYQATGGWRVTDAALAAKLEA